MSKKFEKSIYIQNGKICIKEENGDISQICQDCIPTIKDKINLYIESHPNVFRVQDIIFEVIRDYFNISKVIAKPNDPLYESLLKYVSNNSTYHERIILRRQYFNNNSETVRKNKLKLNSYYDFLSEKVYVEKKRKNLRR